MAPIEIQNGFSDLFSGLQPSAKTVGNLAAVTDQSKASGAKIDFKMIEPLKDLYTFEGQAKI